MFTVWEEHIKKKKKKLARSYTVILFLLRMYQLVHIWMSKLLSVENE
jgi:hypothetical protein